MNDLSLNRPNIAMSLFMFHRVITRGINVSRVNGRKFSQEGFANDELRDGFVKYVSTLSTLINAHHIVEDDLAFPYFRERIPEAPYARLQMDHKNMLPMLAKLNEGAVKIRDAEQESQGLRAADEALGEFAQIWAPHIEIEEKNFDPDKLGRMLPLEEHIRLIGEFTVYSQKHYDSPALMLPFILFNLPETPRQAMMGSMPPDVTEKMIPVVWKEEWSPMTPFLDL